MKPSTFFGYYDRESLLPRIADVTELPFMALEACQSVFHQSRPSREQIEFNASKLEEMKRDYSNMLKEAIEDARNMMLASGNYELNEHVARDVLAKLAGSSNWSHCLHTYGITITNLCNDPLPALFALEDIVDHLNRVCASAGRPPAREAPMSSNKSLQMLQTIRENPREYSEMARFTMDTVAFLRSGHDGMPEDSAMRVATEILWDTPHFANLLHSAGFARPDGYICDDAALQTYIQMQEMKDILGTLIPPNESSAQAQDDYMRRAIAGDLPFSSNAHNSISSSNPNTHPANQTSLRDLKENLEIGQQLIKDVDYGLLEADLYTDAEAIKDTFLRKAMTNCAREEPFARLFNDAKINCPLNGYSTFEARGALEQFRRYVGRLEAQLQELRQNVANS